MYYFLFVVIKNMSTQCTSPLTTIDYNDDKYPVDQILNKAIHCFKSKYPDAKAFPFKDSKTNIFQKNKGSEKQVDYLNKKLKEKNFNEILSYAQLLSNKQYASKDKHATRRKKMMIKLVDSLLPNLANPASSSSKKISKQKKTTPSEQTKQIAAVVVDALQQGSTKGIAQNLASQGIQPTAQVKQAVNAAVIETMSSVIDNATPTNNQPVVANQVETAITQGASKQSLVAILQQSGVQVTPQVNQAVQVVAQKLKQGKKQHEQKLAQIRTLPVAKSQQINLYSDNFQGGYFRLSSPNKCYIYVDQPLVGYSQLYVTPDIKKSNIFYIDTDLSLRVLFDADLLYIEGGYLYPRAYLVFDQDHPYDRIYVEQSKNKYQLYFQDIDGKYLFDGSSCGYFSAITWSSNITSFKGWNLHPVSDQEVQKTFQEQQLANAVFDMVLQNY
jgi:arsenate reductase-like glutaredoxin family protein